VFGEYQKTEPSRFLDEVPIELVERIEPAVSSPFQSRFAEPDFRIDPYARRGRRSSQVHERVEPAYAYEDEDQSVASLRPGMSVRHPTFGLGTVLSVEPLSDDLKLTVRFSDIGRKTLRAKYARLELA
jgi:DNA helicase-2/ATP-dependent DNA helicase PcrA